MADSKVSAEIGRLERTLLGTLQLHAREIHASLETTREALVELEERLSNVENEVGALIRREAAHGKTA